jgi:hypothetical protein
LIGQGKSIFENAVGNRQTLSELNQTNGNDWEGLSDIPTDIYKKRQKIICPKEIKKILKLLEKNGTKMKII